MRTILRGSIVLLIATLLVGCADGVTIRPPPLIPLPSPDYVVRPPLIPLPTPQYHRHHHHHRYW